MEMEDALKYTCPEGQTLPIAMFNNTVNIVSNTKTEGKEISFPRDWEDRPTEACEHYFSV